MRKLTKLAAAYVLLMLLFAACNAAVQPSAQPDPTNTPPTNPSQASPSSAPPTAPDPDGYRYWIEQARLQYHYAESADKMWQVMQCESGGDANAVNPSGYYGLFQYSPDTWAGDWNPYNTDSIYDARAQIFATAKAWYDDNQAWWECY